jgi:flavin-dependent dehydrogenase
MRPRRARIVGAGPAGLSCAMQLRAWGWDVEVCSAAGAVRPVVVLNEVTHTLLAQIWGDDLAEAAGAHALVARTVAWVPDELPSVIEQAAWAVPLADLTGLMTLRASQAGVRFLPAEASQANGPHEAGIWVVQASGRGSMPPGDVITFGQRRALSAPVRLMKGAPEQHGLLESVPGGWLFVIPTGQGEGVLQAMSAQPFADATATLQALLKRSRLARWGIADWLDEAVQYAAMPRVHKQPARPGQIVIGDAALTQDPLSGEGIGTGVRSAVLAAAVMQASDGVHRAPDAIAHYNKRLAYAAHAHVGRCLGLYGQAMAAAHWQGEIQRMHTGLSQLHLDPAPFTQVLGPQGLVAHPGREALAPHLASTLQGAT